MTKTIEEIYEGNPFINRRARLEALKFVFRNLHLSLCSAHLEALKTAATHNRLYGGKNDNED